MTSLYLRSEYTWKMKQPDLHKTGDGSHTLYVKELDEYYHSIHGAVNESVHVFINAAFSFHRADAVKIFEMGLGTGLNVFLTMTLEIVP